VARKYPRIFAEDVPASRWPSNRALELSGTPVAFQRFGFETEEATGLMEIVLDADT
jgi:hypothetical protein